MTIPIKLGTRKSLLAWAQSSLIAEELMRINPEFSIELVGIVTRGDQITDVPLSKIEGKEFFVKEIDEALLTKRVDITVHSMKDLSHDRPDGICLGAVPLREDPRDVVVFNKQIVDALKSGQEILIGTSSPRRLQNIPSFLSTALPQFGSPAKLRFVEIRGNVNTRLARLHETSPQRLDGVVLALAGLNRLAKHHSSSGALTALLQNTRFMVLPLTHSPSAPAQGALAIECRSDDATARKLLATIHDEASAASVNIERNLMTQWGGGCHQRFGITSVNQPEMGRLLFKRGQTPKGYVEDIEYRHYENAAPGPVLDGMDFRAEKLAHSFDESVLRQADAVFLASPAALSKDVYGFLSTKRLWCVGTSSWFKFAKSGLWIEGCADGLGVDHIVPTLNTQVLGLPNLDEWVVLTHADAGGTWTFGKILAPYKIKYSVTDELKNSLRRAMHIYWSSGSQFNAYGKYSRADVTHACGAGKTAEHLRKAGIEHIRIFPSRDAWLAWTAKNQE